MSNVSIFDSGEQLLCEFRKLFLLVAGRPRTLHAAFLTVRTPALGGRIRKHVDRRLLRASRGEPYDGTVQGTSN